MTNTALFVCMCSLVNVGDRIPANFLVIVQNCTVKCYTVIHSQFKITTSFVIYQKRLMSLIENLY